MARLRDALDGLALYQRVPRLPPLPLPEISHRAGKAHLLHYAAPQGDAFPDSAPNRGSVLFVPSLVNGPHILDLDADRSMLRWLAARGVPAYLLDWGKVGPAERDQDIDWHIGHYLLPLIHALPQPVQLVGYCLGGTIALAAACLTDVASLTVIASPWDFSAYPPERTAEIGRMWASHKGRAEEMGLLPMEVLQTGFWSLDPVRVAAKFAGLSGADPASPAMQQFAVTEDWANSGEPLPLAAARQLFEDFYAANHCGGGQWVMDGTVIAPAHVRAPSLAICSRKDVIVPAETAPALAERLDLDTGHVGMVIGSRRVEQLWQPLLDWLTRHGAG